MLALRFGCLCRDVCSAFGQGLACPDWLEPDLLLRRPRRQARRRARHLHSLGIQLRVAIRKATLNQSRLLLHVSTASGQHRREVISPGAIARGKGDGFLISFNRRMARHGEPVYLRWLGEMNNCDNAYSSRRCDGSLRNSDHSPAKFKRAWRRAVLIVRGGDVATIDGKLAALGMRPVDTDAAALPTPQVAFIWSPMTGGSPMIPGLRPGVFWPGAEYVDWVGTSFYSKFPNFRWLTPYYKKFAVHYRKPFAFSSGPFGTPKSRASCTTSSRGSAATAGRR
jgi:hypothetical protein